MLSRLASVSWLKISPCPASQVAGTAGTQHCALLFSLFWNELLIFGRTVHKCKTPFGAFLFKLCIQNNGFQYGIFMHNHGNLPSFIHAPAARALPTWQSQSSPTPHRSPLAFTSQAYVYIVKSRCYPWEETWYCICLPFPLPAPQISSSFSSSLFSTFKSHLCLY